MSFIFSTSDYLVTKTKPTVTLRKSEHQQSYFTFRLTCSQFFFFLLLLSSKMSFPDKIDDQLTPSAGAARYSSYKVGTSPTYSLLEESDRLLTEAVTAPNAFLAKPLFTATSLAGRAKVVKSPPRRLATGAASEPEMSLRNTESSFRNGHVSHGNPAYRAASRTRSVDSADENDEPVTTTIFPVERVRTTSFPALVARAELQLRSGKHDLAEMANRMLEDEQPSLPAHLVEEDVEILKSLHSAAVGLAAGQSGVREATKKIAAVCHQQQSDIESLARQQSSIGVAIDQLKETCIGIEERSRAVGLRVEDCSTQINKIHLQVSNALADSRQSLQRIMTRVVKTTLLANYQAAERLLDVSSRILLKRHFMPWQRRGHCRLVAGMLLSKTVRGAQLLALERWRQLLYKRRRQRRQLSHLSSHTIQAGCLRVFLTWKRYCKTRQCNAAVVRTLLHSTSRGLGLTYLHKWMRYVDRRSAQTALCNHLAGLLYKNQRSHAIWRLATWRRLLHERKVRRKNVRLADLLCSNCVTAFQRRTFRRWFDWTIDRTSRRHVASKLAVVNKRAFVFKFFRVWERFRHSRDIERRIHDKVSRVHSQLDLAMAALGRTGELMTTILERQVELEAQLLQLQASKASIRQLRPEAFRGSLIDLNHADASASSVVRSIAAGAATAATSFSESPQTAVLQSGSVQPAAHDVASAGREVAPAKFSLFEPGMARLLSDSGPSSIAPELHSLSARRSPPPPPSAHSDPLAHVAKHYGVATPAVRRRQLKDS